MGHPRHRAGVRPVPYGGRELRVRWGTVSTGRHTRAGSVHARRSKLLPPRCSDAEAVGCAHRLNKQSGDMTSTQIGARVAVAPRAPLPQQRMRSLAVPVPMRNLPTFQGFRRASPTALSSSVRSAGRTLRAKVTIPPDTTAEREWVELPVRQLCLSHSPDSASAHSTGDVLARPLTRASPPEGDRHRRRDFCVSSRRLTRRLATCCAGRCCAAA